jgi:hypothetical protein
MDMHLALPGVVSLIGLLVYAFGPDRASAPGLHAFWVGLFIAIWRA